MNGNEWERKKQSIQILRWGIVVLLMLGMVNSYFDRMNMSFAATSISHEFGQWVQHFNFFLDGTPDTTPPTVEIGENHAAIGGRTFNPVFFHRQDSVWRVLQSDLLGGDSLTVTSLALDGNQAVISATDTVGRGKILIFEYESPKSDSLVVGEWRFQSVLNSQKNIPDLSSGSPVAIANDWLLVGEPGAAQLYKRAGETWHLATRLLPPPEISATEFGQSVAISQDFAMVGAAGRVIVFQKQDTSWQFFQALESESTAKRFGTALALDDDFAVVNDGTQENGSVVVFQYNSSHWEKRTRLTPEPGDDKIAFGAALDLDGNYVIASANAGTTGAAYIFHREGRRWVQQTRLVPDSTKSLAHFGKTVAISQDDYAIVSAESAHPLAFIFHHQPMDPAEMGLILAMFFWAYGLMQVPAGRLVDKFGIRKLYTTSFFIWAFVATAFGLATSVWMFIVLRGALGVLESVSAPASMAFIGRYFEEKERGLATGIYLAGTKLGPSIGGILAAWLIGAFGWRMLFILCGLVPLIWLIPWEYYYRKLEKRLGERDVTVGEGVIPQADAGKKLIPLKKLFSYRKTWGVFWGAAAYSYVLVLYLSWLPTYFREQMHLSLTEMGAFSGIAFGGVAVMVPLAGAMADFLIRKGLDSSKVRKGFVIAGFLMGALIIPVPYISNPNYAVTVLLIAIVSMGMATANSWAIMQAVAPENTTGTLAGVQNLGGSVGAAVAPLLTGFMVSASGTFDSAFILAGVIMLSGILNYLFLIGKIERIQIQS